MRQKCVFLPEKYNIGLRYLLLPTFTSKTVHAKELIFRENCNRPVTNVKEKHDN